MGKVIKRDGTVDTWNNKKIYSAIFSAAISAGKDEYTAHNISEEAVSKIPMKFINRETCTVEEVQDSVERYLMASKWKDIAKRYIEYRHDRDKARENGSELNKALEGFLSGEDETYTRENANKAATKINTHRDLIAGIISKHTAKRILPDHVINSINMGELHMHDLDYILSEGMTNCGVYDFPYMLANGVKLGDVDIETPKNVQTAANVMCQILCDISGLTYGGQSIHEFDKVLQPYVLKTMEKLESEKEEWGLPDEWVDKKLHKMVYDACQTFLYQSTTCTSQNGQGSFCSISLSLSTDPICKLVKEEYLKCHMKGLGAKHKTPIFPKVLYFAESGVNLNEGDPNYDEFQLAIKCSTKRMYPDYISAINNRAMTGGSENVISPMGKL